MPRALVTGANRGIGLEMTRQLVAAGWEVIAACRTRSIDLDALEVQVEELDVADDESVRRLGERLQGVHLDLLVNNAGILDRDGLDPLDLESIRRQFEVNALGPLKVTAALLGNLGEGSRIVLVTSRMGSIADNTSGGYYGYRMSKAALNAAGVSLARDLEAKGIAVLLVHPGFVKTEMTGGRGTVEPGDAARGILTRIGELDPKESGSFRHADGSPLPW
ncbi:SDR family oxidoreductase [Vulgatibacter sp.]|uniref:SDR family oxidoreductase n=1 Tax=Vulgatibacter sp. TaxID=1971226 RepID=UPI003564ED67